MKQNLSLYLHIPFCVRKCLYCDFLSGPQSADVQEQYVEALCREIQETSPEYREEQVVSVFIGGGTPSVLQPEQTIRIMETVKHCFVLTDTSEISMEMNPGTVTPEKMRAYRVCGINRISIGLQSANDRELKALGRIHTYEDFLKAYEMAVEAGFTNINVDLMSAIPEQTLDSYQETLEKVLALHPQPAHISAYSLIVEKGTPFYEQELNLPDEDTERRMYEITDDILREAGYHRYEISNYAKEGKECFHNKVYWQRGNYLGLGIGSASLIRNVRFHNVTDIQSYVNLMSGGNEQSDVSREHGEKFHVEKEQVEKVNAEIENVKKDNIEKDKNVVERLDKLREEVQELPVEEQMEEFMFLGLRMMEGVSERKFYENFGRRFEEVFPGVIEKHEKLGLLEVTGEEEGKIREDAEKIREESGSKEKHQEERQGRKQEKEERHKVQQGKVQEKQCGKRKEEKKEIKKQEEQQERKEQQEQGREFVRLRLTPHGIDVSNQVFVDFML